MPESTWEEGAQVLGQHYSSMPNLSTIKKAAGDPAAPETSKFIGVWGEVGKGWNWGGEGRIRPAQVLDPDCGRLARGDLRNSIARTGAFLQGDAGGCCRSHGMQR